MRILFADDEKGLIEPLKNLLTLRGHEVDLAFDGLKALELIKQNNYQIAFLDFSLPELTGLEIVESIKHDKIPTKTVIMTGYPLMKDFMINAVGWANTPISTTCRKDSPAMPETIKLLVKL